MLESTPHAAKLDNDNSSLMAYHYAESDCMKRAARAGIYCRYQYVQIIRLKLLELVLMHFVAILKFQCEINVRISIESSDM